MGQALYRKYRSKKLAEIVGQEHITTTLDKALKTGKISHAYLFTGPRGTGKTSIARILAHEVNQLPYDEQSTYLDIIEIDAASNRRIDEIRDLRDRVHSAPTQAKYKVYIIDEVHMLTKEAFNALLKTLEEPPAHVIFILATTEAHKLPDTIVSRTQRFTFRPVDHEKVVAHLRHIAKGEGIAISDEALAVIAQAGGGSFRDSISLLDQASNMADTIELADIQRVLGIAPESTLQLLMQALQSGSVASVMDALQQLRAQGFQSGQIAKQLLHAVRSGITEGTMSDPRILQLATDLLEVPLAHDIDAKLELVLLGYVLPSLPSQPQQSSPAPQPTPAPSAPSAPRNNPKPATQPIAYVQPAPITPAKKPEDLIIVQETEVITPSGEPLTPGDWQTVLGAVKQQYNTLYSVLKMATPEFVGHEITLRFNFPFHQKRINEAKNKQAILDIIKQVTGSQIILTCIVDKTAKEQPAEVAPTPATDPAPVAVAEPAPAPSNSESPLGAISDVFGGAEILES